MPKINHDFDDFYFAIYTYDDELVTVFDTIDNLTRFFNRPKKYIFFNLRNNICFELDHHWYKVYVYPKYEIDEQFTRKKLR